MIATDRTAAVLRALARECAALESWSALVDTERSALLARDADAVQEIAARKLRAADELAALMAGRNAALDAAGYSAAQGGQRGFTRANTQAAHLWQRLQQLATAAGAANRRCGQLIDAGLQQTARALAILRQDTLTSLYSADGQPAVARGARALATA